MEKISAVYKIVNTVTGDSYIGSSKDVFHRWACHKCMSTWKKEHNKPLYIDMQKYGLDAFRFQILAPVMPDYLKQVEQEFIEMLQPAYNTMRAIGWDVERRKEWMKKYEQSTKRKDYLQSDKHKGARRNYDNKLCSYNGETLTFCALRERFRRAGVKYSTQETKKYLKNN